MTQEELSADTQEKILNGYRSAGTIFRTMVEELEVRYGKEVAHDIARAAVWKKGLAAGSDAAKTAGTGGLRQLAAAHQRAFAGEQILELSETRYATLDNRCGIVTAWRSAGLPEDRIRELADIYCWGDLAYARAFNPNIQLTFVSRIAEGAPCCHWLFSLPADQTGSAESRSGEPE